MAAGQITNRINAVLAERGIDKGTFYNDCKITSAAFSQWATGKTEPRMKTLKTIADYLGVSVEYLLADDVFLPPEPHYPPPKLPHTDDLAESIEILRTRPETRFLLHQCSDMTKEQVEQVAKMMVSLKGGNNGAD